MKNFLFILLFLISFDSYATHNRAGEITFKHISGYTYEVTITTYTYRYGKVERSYLTIEWGDNTFDTITREGTKIELPNDYDKNIYTKTHTYPGPGIYEIVMQDPNRNVGIKNIPNSVYTYFSIKTLFIINASLGNNSSPVLLNPPKDRAALNRIFIHNPSAYDPDGDSLAYKITTCLAENGLPIEDYTLPEDISINEVTGDLIWNVPRDTGRYNVAMLVEEYRDNVKISSIVRDIQIDVVRADNNPPVNDPVDDLCAVAGDTISFTYVSRDEDLDNVTHNITGGPLVVDSSKATTVGIDTMPGYFASRFTWITNCLHVRKIPYQLLLKAEDNNAEFNMVDLDNFYIRIISPPPNNLQLSSTSDFITLNWDACPCDNAVGYHIYRKEMASGYIPDSCETGVPAATGYELIASVEGNNTTTYIDDNNGNGLLQGEEYCYMVTAYYNDMSESIASNEACISLVPGSPGLINANVVTEDAEIFLAWAMPRQVDSFGYAPPYVFEIYRSDTLTQESFELLDTIVTYDLTDTTYTDFSSFDSKPVYYTVLLKPYGQDIQLGSNEIASTIFPAITPMDNKLRLDFIKKVPWVNYTYTIYRSNSFNGIYDSVGSSNNDYYLDTDLANGREYCYKIRSTGSRTIDSILYTSVNYSHINCGTPQDNEPPCPTELSVGSNCDSLKNMLEWKAPDSGCENDIVLYRIYYAPQINQSLQQIDSVFGISNLMYYHDLSNEERPTGCYYVTAVDSVGNESEPSNLVCVDNCSLYDLPNFFTPNGDNVNDQFVAENKNNYIKKVDMKIFSRWGSLVYKTEDPYINWDGRHMNSNQLVSSGVYYYICDVYEPRISGEEINTRVGYIYVFGDEEKAKFNGTE